MREHPHPPLRLDPPYKTVASGGVPYGEQLEILQVVVVLLENHEDPLCAARLAGLPD